MIELLLTAVSTVMALTLFVVIASSKRKDKKNKSYREYLLKKYPNASKKK